jgi:hypothetical protein
MKAPSRRPFREDGPSHSWPWRAREIGAPGWLLCYDTSAAVHLDDERVLSLVRRDLGAVEAHIVEATASPPGADSARELRCELADGRVLLARFSEPLDDRETRQRRLEMLASTFDAVVQEPGAKPRSRPPLIRSLQDELKALSERAGAANAVVIDANSPVVWGAATTDGLGSDWPLAWEPWAGDEPSVGAAPPAVTAGASREAIDAVRSLSAFVALRKGKHLRHVERQGRGPFLAHSFAGIYLLVLVFDSPFDELRAERAVAEWLPRIEGLVLALPPLDPSPQAGAGAVSIRKAKRQ